jgi:hypothetical protein
MILCCYGILPLCEQLTCLRVRFSELVAFHSAVIKKANSENLPEKTAAFHVLEDIENYERIGGLKNEISKLVTEIYY